MSAFWEKFLRFRIGLFGGLIFYIAGLLNYRSYESKAVLGIWSYQFLIVILASIAILIFALIYVWRSRKAEDPGADHNSPVPALFDFGLLFWGIAYFISAVDISDRGSRIADLDFFGSEVPVAVILEWLAMILFFLALVVFLFSRLPAKWKNPMLAIASLGIIVLLGEGAVRIRAIISPIVQGFPTHTSIIWNRYYCRLNSEGFRDVEHTLDKPAGVKRLLTIGDSFAYGWGIKNIENRFGEQLASRLARMDGERWESLNGARSNTHTLEHIAFLKQMLPYHPDVVVLLYYFNDISYLHNERIDLFLMQRFNIMGILFKNSYFFQEIYVNVRKLSFKYDRNKESLFDPYKDSDMVARHIEDIKRFVATGQEAGASMWVVPFDITVVEDQYMRDRYRTFSDQLIAAGVPTVPLNPDYDGHSLTELTVNRYDAHANEMVYRIISEEVAEQLLPHLK